ncbi:MAG: C1 family peptidase [Lentisphaeria bacterium]|nr:C1 family peptidase [Lentisphaeria bacterium]
MILALLAAGGGAGEELPSGVDLRPQFAALGLTPKSQGRRGCCSLFAITGLLEFEHARRADGEATRFSEEFLNWASHRSNGRATDGSFFADAVRGVAMFGICREALMPYAAVYAPGTEPSSEALADALGRRRLRACWIKRWDVRSGMTEAMLAEIRRQLAGGHPVAIGMRWPRKEQYDPQHVLAVPGPEDVFDGHSVILVGYDDRRPGERGGAFLFRNSSGGAWRDGGYAWLPYAYAEAYGNDALSVRVAEGEPWPSNRGACRPLEIETLTLIEAAECPWKVQSMAPWGGPLWSGGSQVFCSPAAGGRLVVEVPVAEAGVYDLGLYATRAPDYGIVRVSLDGRTLAAGVDLHAAEVVPSGLLPLGRLRLEAGKRTLEFECVGRNPASRGTFLGIDCIDLVPEKPAR